MDDASGPIAALAEHFVERAAALDPIAATFEGIPGHDGELTDYSPDGTAERLDQSRSTLRELATTLPGDEAERVAAEVLRRYLDVGIELMETSEDLRALRVIGSPVSEIRLCFDLMPRATPDDWATVVARVAAVPQALDTLRQSLDEGVRAGVVAARRQAVACAQQADTWGGVGTDATPFFRGLVDEHDAAAIGDDGLRSSLDAAATRATAAYASFGRYLVEEYLPARDRAATRSARSDTAVLRGRSRELASISTTRTPGVGRSCTGSKTPCTAWESESCPASRSRRSSTTSSTIRRG